MRLSLFISGFAFLTLFCTGCSDTETAKPVTQHIYFDVPGFIDNQVSVLEKEGAPLQKTVGFGSQKPESKTLQKVNWPLELTFFKEIDLNKKALAGNYTETRTTLPDGEKLIYTRNPDAAAPIARLEITTNNKKQLSSLFALYEQKNGLFFNREVRNLKTDSQGIISTYQVTGVQKVLLFDSIFYKVVSTLP